MIVVTGSTGFLGRQLLRQILREYPERIIGLIVRPSAQQSAAQRVEALLNEICSPQEVSFVMSRTRIISGDVTLPKLGLRDSEYQTLASSIEYIFHCAATTSFTLSLEKARRINLGGTIQVVRLAQAAQAAVEKFKGLMHVSTAYVANSSEQVIQPDDLSLSPPFYNSYERTKAEAEAFLRLCEESLPFCVVRPSIVAGDSETGVTSSFSALYVPARLVTKGFVKALPGFGGIPVDIVSVDHVARVMVALAKRNLFSGESFHITTGLGRESSPGQFFELLADAHRKWSGAGENGYQKPPPFIPPEVYLREGLGVTERHLTYNGREVASSLNVLRQLSVFVPYMAREFHFDLGRTEAALGEQIARPKRFSSYSQQIFEFCLFTDWGRTRVGNLPVEQIPQAVGE